MSIDKAEEYDAVIFDYADWECSRSLANEYFVAGIPLITIGNDTKAELYVIKSNENANLRTIINPVIDNISTRKLSISNISFKDSRKLIKFIDKVEIWYQETIDNGDIYDAMGIYEENNTQWIHSQYHKTGPKSEYLLDCIFKKYGARFELEKGKQYTIYGLI